MLVYTKKKKTCKVAFSPFDRLEDWIKETLSSNDVTFVIVKNELVMEWVQISPFYI